MNNNPCIRCGKQRIVSKTYKKIIDNSTVIYTEMVCPDPECQKLLNMQLQTEKEKREMLAVQKQKQAQDRIDEKNNRW